MRGLFEESVLTYLAIAKEFKSPILRIVTDTSTFKPEAGEVVERVRKLTGRLETAGVVLAIENHDRFDSSSPRLSARSQAHGWGYAWIP